jgi:SET domain-containing protein
MTVDPQFAAFPLLIRSSRIDRRGVFAEANIPARRKVVQYTGEKISLVQALRRVRRILMRRGPKRLYIAKINRRWALDGARGGSGAQYINHCCDPNLFIRRSRGQIHFYSRKPIRKGQELTLDYRFGPSANPIACHCGSRKCRGTINRLK